VVGALEQPRDELDLRVIGDALVDILREVVQQLDHGFGRIGVGEPIVELVRTHKSSDGLGMLDEVAERVLNAERRRRVLDLRDFELLDGVGKNIDGERGD
jgi:hypothetical protein